MHLTTLVDKPIGVQLTNLYCGKQNLQFITHTEV
jgi:hypothetical protein